MDIASKGRSIRQIPLSRKNESRASSVERKAATEPVVKKGKIKKARNYSKIGYFVLGIIILFGILFSTVFSGGKLVITPRNEITLFDASITAKQSSGDVSFETMTLEREASKEVTATGETNVEEKASGKIIIYNNFSTEPQTLITNTRFESNQGLVYRIRETVKVPGKKTTAGETIPGSLEVTVYADQAGEKYNIGLSDFTLPALKGSAQYSKIYARSKTDITGGFVGLKKMVSAEERSKAKEELQERLKAELFKEAASSKTDGYVLWSDAVFIRFENLPEETKDGKVYVKEKAILYGILFDKKTLSKYIAVKTVSSYTGEDVMVENLEELDFTTLNKEEVRPWESGEIVFNLMGSPLIVWQFDENKLQNELAGKLKKEVRAILTTYPSIERAEISLRPFWNRTFPKNPAKIKLVKKIDKKEVE